MDINELLKNFADTAVNRQKEQAKLCESFKADEQLNALDKFTKQCIGTYDNSKDKVNLENITFVAKKGIYRFDLFSIKNDITYYKQDPWRIFVLPDSNINASDLQITIKYSDTYYNMPTLNEKETSERVTKFVNIAGSRVCNYIVSSFTKYCISNNLNLKIKDECNSEKPNAYVYWD
jgi:hypothetical protein